MGKKPWFNLGLGVLLFFLSWDVFLYGVQKPDLPYFDEVNYVSAARQHLHGGVNENWVHPPLAKWLLSLGIRNAGDNPFGWRIMSTLFGALSVGLTFVLGLILFGQPLDALAVALFTLLNQVHYVQSRIATLDVFMVTFTLAGVCATAWLWLRGRDLSLRQQIATVLVAGLAFGAAVACKWAALAPSAVCTILMGVRLAKANGRRIWLVAVALLVPAAIYFFANLLLLGMTAPRYQPALDDESGQPEHHYSVKDLLTMQLQIADKQMAFNNPRHPYTSDWYTWPLMIRPMWYSFSEWVEPEGNRISAVYLVGNPLIFWFGFAAIFLCAWWGFVRRSPESTLIVSLYLVSLLLWAILPRKLGFFYYYYPAAMFLGPALVEARRKLNIGPRIWYAFVALCFAVFVFFYPVLSGAEFPVEMIWSRFLFRSWSS